VSLQADVADLLKLHVGVDATLGGVQLTIKVSRRRYYSRCASTTWPGSWPGSAPHFTAIDNNPRTQAAGGRRARSRLDLPEQSASCLQAHSPAGQPDPLPRDEIASAVLVHEYVQVS